MERMIEMQKQIKLKNRPMGLPKNEDFEFSQTSIGEPGEGEVLVRTIYISVDPYLRGRKNDVKSYIPPCELDSLIKSGVIGQVVASKTPNFQKNDVAMGTLGWQEYSAVKEKELRKIDADIAPPSAYLSVLGTTGLTAYCGLLEIGQPQQGETVVVSGAAGAVSSVVRQTAKIKGAKVVGIAGSYEKVKYIGKEVGSEEAINYKTEEASTALEK